MALIECKFYSDVLQLSTAMTVILPQQTQSQIGMQNIAATGKYKTLYLLHGLSDDHTIWQRRTSIERYAAPLGIAIVMPAVDRSFYTNMAYGKAYETFVAEELPQLARSFFPLSEQREDNYVAGLSMGGYGAFKLALNYPERYCAAASLSGALDLAVGVEHPEERLKQDFINVFGSNVSIRGTRHDLLFVLKQMKAEDKARLRLYQCCGDQDFLYQSNLIFRDAAIKEGFDLTWQSDPDYEHTWDYWNLRIQAVLQWMFGAVGK